MSIRALLLSLAVLFATACPALAVEYSLVIEQGVVTVDGDTRRAITINGTVPGPVLRLTEGETAVIKVTNKLKEETSIHWHGLILDGIEDGVPGLNGFPGIKPGQTYTYRIPIRQNGTYWYHAHSATQEQAGHYGAMVIAPAGPPADVTDRDYVVQLSESTPEDPERMLRNLKVDPGYYNYNKRTVGDFFRDAGKFGLGKAWSDRREWGKMRMDPTDIADTGGFTLLTNGKGPATNETFLFTPGQKVRLRFINSSAMSFLDVRIPGLKLTVVATDGRDVVPVTVDEFRIAPAEIYDVIVTPAEDRAYTVFAESIGRDAYARATLAPRAGMQAAVPPMRPRAVLTMSEMGDMGGGGHDHGGAAPANPAMRHAGHDHAAMLAAQAKPANPPMGAAGHNHAAMLAAQNAPPAPAPAGSLPVVDYGMGKNPMVMPELSPEGSFDGSGRVFGWSSGAPQGSRVLSYADLRSRTPQPDVRAPDREIVVRLGGTMERYIWTLNGQRYEDSKPFQVKLGERVKLTFINDTMMAHPMHLHGMFFQLDNGAEPSAMPDKNVLSVAPGRTASAILTADAAGEWAFHCHLLFHMEAGMMQHMVVAKVDGPAPAAPAHNHSGHGAH